MGKVKEQSIAYSTKKKSSVQSIVTKPKQAVLKMLRNLRDDVTYEDLMYELYVLEKIERGLRQLDEGKGIPHEEVKKSLSRWLQLQTWRTRTRGDERVWEVSRRSRKN